MNNPTEHRARWRVRFEASDIPTDAIRSPSSRRIRNSEGFTLIELLVVVAILAVLAGTAIPLAKKFIGDTEQVAAETSLETILLSAAVDAYGKDRSSPDLGDVQRAFDASRAGSVLGGPKFTVCLQGTGDSCAVTGTRVDYVRSGDEGESFTAVVVHAKKRVLGKVIGFATEAWIKADGTILDAIAGPTNKTPDENGGLTPLDVDAPTYRAVSATEEGEWANIYEGVNEATVDVQVKGGLALIVVAPLDANGEGQSSSPIGCGIVDRSVISGSGLPINCPGDGGYDPGVVGSPYGVACTGNCRIHLSSAERFDVDYFHIPVQFGGSAFDVQSVEGLID